MPGAIAALVVGADRLGLPAYLDYDPHGLDILVKFLRRACDRMADLAERQKVLLAILRLAEDQGAQFASPTRAVPEAPR